MAEKCPVCEHEDDGSPGFHLCSGMRPVGQEEAVARGAILDRETQERIAKFIDEADRCRARAAVEARTAWIA